MPQVIPLEVTMKNKLTKNNEQISFQPYWCVTDVANYLKVSKGTVYYWAYHNLLRHRRFGGCVRFVPDEIISDAQKNMIGKPVK